ncbi:hypothetical protein T05_2053 [Trichinella murrelli]|uniref:Uncharacterized protein n=1 Tax=Trichinella murrelli TaxID=144512 RepID=A0A0V0SSY6_9BILA|nr:hypothetical protein T05_2053 [Trichinella murrelli]
MSKNYNKYLSKAAWDGLSENTIKQQHVWYQ